MLNNDVCPVCGKPPADIEALILQTRLEDEGFEFVDYIELCYA